MLKPRFVMRGIYRGAWRMGYAAMTRLISLEEKYTASGHFPPFADTFIMEHVTEMQAYCLQKLTQTFPP